MCWTLVTPLMEVLVYIGCVCLVYYKILIFLILIYIFVAFILFLVCLVVGHIYCVLLEFFSLDDNSLSDYVC